jgi:hypothetical protein
METPDAVEVEQNQQTVQTILQTGMMLMSCVLKTCLTTI